MATTTKPMTAEELLALPDDGIRRELIRGELREYPDDPEHLMTTRGMPHCRVTAKLSHLIHKWLERQPSPRGWLFAGDIRVRIHRDPDTFVGIDLAYISADLAAQAAEDATFIDGMPVLTIEILSPSDTVEGIREKRRAYLDAGVRLVWEVDPFSKVVTVYRPGMPPELFNVTQDLTAEPYLPGFRVPVAEIFAP
jgi:Uma2 family endonuclease